MAKIKTIFKFIIEVFVEMSKVRADSIIRNKHYY